VHRPTLGTFRFSLALIVFWSHIAPRPFQFLYENTHGLIAVMMFFMVSGYLISNALETFYVGRVRDFAINRFLRIYPCYWIVFAVSVGVSLFYRDPICFAALAYYLCAAATWDLSFTHPISSIPYFALGVAVSRVELRRGPRILSLALLGASLAIVFIAFGHTVVSLSAPNLRLFAPIDLKLGPDPFNLFNFGILLVMFVGCLLINVGGPLRALDNYLGDLAYPLFISHYTVNALIGYFFEWLPDLPRMWLSFIVALCVAVVLWWAVDSRISKLRDRVRGFRLYQDGASVLTPRAAT
jgi:peptidoglycan/LPS O-acetylase OafA/YrhL